ncbi:glycosyltransferase family 2 protein [Paenibacillus sp. NPDC057934]|uniref:glycosyltransferase family 2 protein n=1 Tax=Paenibacillus sp. NPDC057934 TaxID=3346282 RepID=UPI0036DF9F72
MPKLSVIMCTYNRGHYLSRSVESVLSQTLDDFEFVLVNNGSTDDSLDICKYYAEKDSRIKLIDIIENKGASSGRNAGLLAASCNYITIVDDDDVCYPEMLQFLWDLSQKYNADISMCGSWNQIEDQLEPYFIFDELLVLDKVQSLDALLQRQKYNVAPPTKLFHKKLFKDILFKENVLVDDIHVIYKVFANANLVVAQGKPLYSFTKHSGNMTNFIQTNIIPPALLSEYHSAFRERTEYLSKRVPEIAPRARYAEMSFMISMCGKIPRTSEYVDLYNVMVEKLRESYDELICSPYLTEKEELILENILSSSYTE